MPAVNPRIQVMLPKAQYKALAALAKRQSRSMSSIAGELLSEILPHVGAAQSLMKDLAALSPERIAALQKMAESVEAVNLEWIAELGSPAAVDLARTCPQCGHQMSSVAHAKACGGLPRQMDVEDAIAASVKTAPRKSARGSSEQSLRAIGAKKAPKPPGTNRGV
jgi:hypothetical protein